LKNLFVLLQPQCDFFSKGGSEYSNECGKIKDQLCTKIYNGEFYYIHVVLEQHKENHISFNTNFLDRDGNNPASGIDISLELIKNKTWATSKKMFNVFKKIVKDKSLKVMEKHCVKETDGASLDREINNAILHSNFMYLTKVKYHEVGDNDSIYNCLTKQIIEDIGTSNSVFVAGSIPANVFDMSFSKINKQFDSNFLIKR